MPARHVIAAAMVIGVAACGGGGGLGESCDHQSDCADSLQCLDGVCVPRCTVNPDCGDGHVCDRGICRASERTVGEACDSEYDCMAGLSCQLFDEDLDNDGQLTASCQPEMPGGVLDDPCTEDTDCRTGTCALGRCVDVCADAVDCPTTHVCTEIPREILVSIEQDDYAGFLGCLPATGNVTYDIPVSSTSAHFLLPIPGNAVSLALVAEIDSRDELVGAARIYRPGEKEPYFATPDTREEYFSYRIRTDLTQGTWTLVLPQSPEVPLPVGEAYAVELGSWVAPHVPGNEVPEVQAIYRVGSADPNQLDLHFYFLDLSHHPCDADPALEGAPLSAATAQISPQFQDVFLHELLLAFADVPIELKTVSATYQDILDRQDLDGLDVAKLGDLLSLSTGPGGMNIFFVRTIFPSGIQAISGGPPVPPGVSGTRASGVAVAMDTLCYRDWTQLARSTAHEIARALGLQRSVEPDGYTDPIADSDFGSDNLMYFSENGGKTLSPGQKSILRKSPALR